MVPRSLLHAVKTGFRTNPLRVSESDQLQMFRDIGIESKRLWAVSERLTPAQCKVRVDAKIPSQFIRGKLTLVDCTVQNLSDAFLTSEPPYPINISYRWKHSVDPVELDKGDGNRTFLPRMLMPGSEIHCRIDVLAPETEGEYELVVTLVQESVAWFNDVDASNGCCARVRVVQAENANSIAAD